MRLATQAQSQIIDQKSVSHFHLTNENLMENAGLAVLKIIENHFSSLNKHAEILIVSGPGNNGADGFVVGRLLKEKGYLNVHCFIAIEPHSPSPIWLLQKNKTLRSGTQFLKKSNVNFKNYSVIIDAIFGMGQNKIIDPVLKKTVDQINISSGKKIAIDLPTGLHSDTGCSLGSIIKADATVTFGFAKPGFFIQEGPTHTGTVYIDKLSFPSILLNQTAISHFAFTQKNAKKILPTYKPASHKYDHGKIIIFAGSKKFPGAGALCSRASYRTGAGLVTLANFDQVYENRNNNPEIIIGDFNDISFDQKHNETVIIGPGLGVSLKSADLIRKLKELKHPRVVIDADGIATCSKFNLWPLPSSWVWTPHSGELSKVLHISSQKINENRYTLAMQASSQLGGVVLLKGFHTIVAIQNKCQVILSGNSALSKAGTGDVLTGMIGAFLAQGLSPIGAASLGAYIHGYTADLWLQYNDQISMLASDVIEMLPKVFKKIREN